MKLKISLIGRGYDAAAGLPEHVELAASASIAQALEAVAALLPEGEKPAGSCLVVHNGQHLGTVDTHREATLRDQDDLVLIAPVAGG